jgi:hypothetical protein
MESLLKKRVIPIVKDEDETEEIAVTHLLVSLSFELRCQPRERDCM